MRRALTLGIVASWLVLVAVLVRKQAPSEPLPSTPLPLTGVTARDEWFGIYKDGRKIGHAHRVVATRSGGYEFSEDSEVALAMLGVPQTLRSALRAETDDGFALRTFSYTLVTPATTFTASGTSDDHTLRARYGPKGQEADLVLPLTEPIALPSTLRPRILAEHPAPGTRYSLPVFSPLTTRSEPLTVVVEAHERLETRAGPVDTIEELATYARFHPWVIVLGLLAGGFLASKYAPAWGSVWGSHHAAHAREKSFNGVKPKRRKR